MKPIIGKFFKPHILYKVKKCVFKIELFFFKLEVQEGVFIFSAKAGRRVKMERSLAYLTKFFIFFRSLDWVEWIQRLLATL